MVAQVCFWRLGKIRFSRPDVRVCAKPFLTVHKRAAYFWFPAYPLIDGALNLSAPSHGAGEARSNFSDGIGDPHTDFETASAIVEDY